jgi:hypothetical protein
MKSVEKIFIAASLVIILLVSGGIYVNSKLNRIFEHIGMVGVILSEGDPARGPSAEPGEGSSPDGKIINRDDKGSAQERTPTVSSAEDLLYDEELEAIIQTRLDKPIERSDKIKVALILIKNLSVDEITYFYDLITLGYNKDDIRKARTILSANLSEEDMEILRSMADKYGFKL